MDFSLTPEQREIQALEMIEQAVHAGLPQGVVLGDCGYGNNTVFRDTLTQLGQKEINGQPQQLLDVL